VSSLIYLSQWSGKLSSALIDSDIKYLLRESQSTAEYLGVANLKSTATCILIFTNINFLFFELYIQVNFKAAPNIYHLRYIHDMS
jgi:hypothetical protein